ncbi:MAG: Nudix family hydrolase [Betaproteobacteria bacterium]|nr:Nudix family hydrolase [Betaproteobacteria bacterium]
MPGDERAEIAASDPRPVTRVAAAVLLRADGSFLLAQRPVGKVYAGYWEFPGGKLEADETPRHALDRELREELGIVVRQAYPWIVRRFAYEHAHVELHFFRVLTWAGELHAHEGQAFAWQKLDELEVSPLLPANAPVLAALRLPTVYGITMASELGIDAQIARAERALKAGLKLIQVREPGLPAASRARLAKALCALAHAHGAQVLLNGSADEARSLGLAGLHWPARVLLAAREKPADLLVGASCHNAAELAQAVRRGVDFVVLGPVAATPTHPEAEPLGWVRWAELARALPMPVYALGGLGHDDLRPAWQAGAHGIALRRGAWGV